MMEHVMPARTVTAWGRSSSSRSRVGTPDRVSALKAMIMAPSAQGVIARGCGRSYGDQCLNEGGVVVDTTGLSAIRSFDTTTGVIHCEAGVTFAELMPVCLDAGWIPAVCPGTSFVSMGGAVANDVHGKNQHHEGTFGDHVDWLDLLLPSGEIRRISRENDASLFRATIAGMGLTGIVTSLQFRLKRARSNAFVMTESRVPTLDAFLEVLQHASEANEHAVGWIDAMSGGNSMGRGVLQVAQQGDATISQTRRREYSVPLDFPSWILNRATVGAFNSVYYHRVPARGRTRTVHAAQFLYPLDAVHQWNRLYGKRGVYQFQCALPYAASQSGLRAIMQETVNSGRASFLAVLKCMGRRGAGLLSFTRPGFSLALDFPRRPSTFALVQRLHDIVIDHGGAIYLAKDACLTTAQFESMYPEASEFKARSARVDPNRVMQSDMARRIGLR